MRDRLKLISLAFALSLFTGSAYAQGGYLAGFFGYTTLDSDTGFDDSDLSYRFGGGLHLNRHFAVEGYFVNHGEPSDSGIRVEPTGLQAQIVGFLPVSPTGSLYGKIGILLWDADICAGSFCDDDDGTDIVYGVGAAFELNRNVTLRAEYEWGELDVSGAVISADVDHNTLMIGLSFHF